jgi:hypothetical protein
MEEAPKNGMELSHSANASGMNERMLYIRGTEVRKETGTTCKCNGKTIETGNINTGRHVTLPERR